MTDIRKEQTATSSLAIGMFICELDRPWLGTPFLLEGLLIEDDAQIATLKTLCQFVYVDRTVSVGQHYLAPPKKAITMKQQPSNTITHAAINNNSVKKLPTTEAKIHDKTEQLSFFTIIKEIKAFEQNAVQPISANNTQLDKKHSNQKVAIEADEPITGVSLSKQIKTDLSNFVLGLKDWRPNLKRKNQDAPSEQNVNKVLTKSDDLNEKQSIVTEEKYPVEQEISIIYPVYEKTQVVTQ